MNRTLSLLAVVALSLPGAAVANTYEVDANHSSMMFKARHFGVSNVYGRFNDFSGTIRFDEADPAKGSVKLEIRTESVDSGVERRDNHLRSPDFFNAKQFPVMAFESSRVEKLGDARYRVSGELTLLGVTKPLSAEVEMIGMGKHPRTNAPIIGFETRLTLKRSDFGMNFMVGPVGDDIDVLVAVEAAAQ